MCPIFKTPHASVYLRPKFFHHLDLGSPILHQPPLQIFKWYRACERTRSKQNQVTSHSNSSSVLLFDLAHKQYNGVIKGWLHCLMSESKGRFLVNTTLMFGSAWYLVMSQIKFFFLKKNKDWMSRTLATTHPLGPIISHFCLTPTSTLHPQSERHMCITP